MIENRKIVFVFYSNANSDFYLGTVGTAELLINSARFVFYVTIIVRE